MSNPKAIKAECERIWMGKGVVFACNKAGWRLGSKDGVLLYQCKGAKMSPKIKRKRK